MIVAVIVLSAFLAISLTLNGLYVRLCDRWKKLYRNARIREERVAMVVNELLAEVERRDLRNRNLDS